MKVIFQLEDFGTNTALFIFTGYSGNNYTFLNKRDGLGYRHDFEGTPEEYRKVMRDLLKARPLYHTVFVEFPPQHDVNIDDLKETVTNLQAENEALKLASKQALADLQGEHEVLKQVVADFRAQSLKTKPKAPAKPSTKPTGKKTTSSSK
jgi:hypothetical protein